MGKDSRRQSTLDRIAARELGGLGGGGGGIRPTGRAPRGQGPTYAARRRIANRLDSMRARQSRLQNTIDTTRGQARFRRRDTLARQGLQQLRRGIAATSTIANAPGDWQFKEQLIRDTLTSIGL